MIFFWGLASCKGRAVSLREGGQHRIFFPPNYDESLKSHEQMNLHVLRASMFLPNGEGVLREKLRSNVVDQSSIHFLGRRVACHR